MRDSGNATCIEPAMTALLDCAIVGAGPGGLTAAVYLSRFRRSIVVLDAGNSRARWIPESHNCPGFPSGISGDAFLVRMAAQARSFGARIESAEVASIERLGNDYEDGFALDSGGARFDARCVVLATGCEDLMPRLEGLEEAVACAALRFCPVCDAFEAVDRDIAVHGPFASAARHALFLRTYSPRVTVVPTDADASAHPRGQELHEAGIAATSVPTDMRFDGERCSFLIDAQRRTFDVVYAMLGSRQRSGLALSLGAHCDDEGALHVDSHLRTSVPGLYAIGDVVSALNQIAVATGHAAIAATAVHNALSPRYARAFSRRSACLEPAAGVDMQRTLMKRFERFDDAQRARDALIAGGLNEAEVELHSLTDEAGAEKGNFAVGNGEPARGAHDAYELNFEDAESAGSNLLVVYARDERQHARIDAMLDGMGGMSAGASEART
jgi:thioredoxin reductase (NADPH)